MGTIEQIRRKFSNQKALNSAFSNPGPHEFVMVLDHLKPNYNIGKILRTVEIFGGREVHMVGIPFFNPYPSKGAFKYVPCSFFDTVKESLQVLRDRQYHVFVLDPLAEKNLYEIEMPARSAFIVGHEFYGVSVKPEDICEHVTRVKIPQYGKIQSLNAAVAASLAMYEYMRQRGQPQRPPDL